MRRPEDDEAVMGELTNRLLSAMKAHELDASSLASPRTTAASSQLIPNREFRGRDKVRENWAGVFSGIPDFKAELLSSAIADEGAEIGEWRWRGRHVDGSTFAMRGMTVMGVTDDHIASGRLYMEIVEEDGADIDEMVQETYRPAGVTPR